MSSNTDDPTERGNFNKFTAASALLFNNDHIGNSKALRVECPDLRVEFTDNMYIGTDPDGMLFYNGINDFDVGSKANTHYYKVSKVLYKNKPYLVIYWHRNSDTDPYAKFVAEDPKNAVTANKMDGYSSHGDWVELEINSAEAAVAKTSTNPIVTVDAPDIEMKATWTIKDIFPYPPGSSSKPSNLEGKTYTVQGNLYFRNFTTLKQSAYANYDNDRIVFYSNDYTGRDFTAYFIPLEDEPQSLQDPTAEYFKNVHWGAK